MNSCTISICWSTEERMLPLSLPRPAFPRESCCCMRVSRVSTHRLYVSSIRPICTLRPSAGRSYNMMETYTHWRFSSWFGEPKCESRIVEWDRQSSVNDRTWPSARNLTTIEAACPALSSIGKASSQCHQTRQTVGIWLTTGPWTRTGELRDPWGLEGIYSLVDCRVRLLFSSKRILCTRTRELMGDHHADIFQSKCQVLQRPAECLIGHWRMRYTAEIVVPEIKALVVQHMILFSLHLLRL